MDSGAMCRWTHSVCSYGHVGTECTWTYSAYVPKSS